MFESLTPENIAREVSPLDINLRIAGLKTTLQKSILIVVA